MKADFLYSTNQTLELPQIALVYGQPMSGKTSWVSLFAESYRLHWIDLDGKFQSMYNHLDQAYWGNIEVYRVTSQPGKPHAANTVSRILKSTSLIKICDAHGEVSCQVCTKSSASFTTFDPTTLTTKDIIVVDNLTTLSESILERHIGFTDEWNFRKPEYSDIAKWRMTLSTFFTYAKSRGCHVIFISHEEEMEQEDGTHKLTPVGATRAFATTMAGKFHHVLHTKFANGKFQITSLAAKDMNAQVGSVSGLEVKDKDSLLKLFKGK